MHYPLPLTLYHQVLTNSTTYEKHKDHHIHLKPTYHNWNPLNNNTPYNQFPFPLATYSNNFTGHKRRHKNLLAHAVIFRSNTKVEKECLLAATDDHFAETARDEKKNINFYKTKYQGIQITAAPKLTLTTTLPHDRRKGRGLTCCRSSMSARTGKWGKSASFHARIYGEWQGLQLI